MVVLYVPSQAINQGGLSSQSDMPDMDEARGNITLSFFFFGLIMLFVMLISWAILQSFSKVIGIQQSCVIRPNLANTLSQIQRQHTRQVASRYMGNLAKLGIVAKGKRKMYNHYRNAQQHKEKMTSKSVHEKKDCHWGGCLRCTNII